MKKYIQPYTEIIPSTTSENLLLEGSYAMETIKPGEGGPIEVGGDEANTFNKSLWDEE